MSAANPFFGQSVISIDSGKKEVVGSFPNWGVMEEDQFRNALWDRIASRLTKPFVMNISRLEKVGGPDPTFWVIKLGN